MNSQNSHKFDEKVIFYIYIRKISYSICQFLRYWDAIKIKESWLKDGCELQKENKSLANGTHSW